MNQPIYYYHPFDQYCYYSSFNDGHFSDYNRQIIRPIYSFPHIPGHSPFITDTQMLWRLIFAKRIKEGKGPIHRSPRLDKVATLKAHDMANINACPASHYSSTFGGDEGIMLSQAGISGAAGWIIYCGKPGTYADAFNWWMNISTHGHRENILNPRWNALGVGKATSQDGTVYWSVIFHENWSV
ncbi:CAP domain-containing protein [Bacillus cereus group sp. BfR-BA-01441]|uniref:CAP domain-containing protein n=1 Tax=Bacillus cereus group sp. BfR-BA-01441 TaxID=2920348 RepID=UPI001F565ACF